MIVMKFGGTSLAGRARLRAAAQITLKNPKPRVVVVSALGDTTDRLFRAGDCAEAGDLDEAGAIASEITRLHHDCVPDGPVRRRIDQQLAELSRLLEGIYLLREQTLRSRALLASFGERLSAPIFAAHLAELGQPAEAVDARKLIVTDEQYDGGRVLLGETRRRVLADIPARVDKGVTPVVTGFVAATQAGVTTTLGRGGSDYSATLLASIIDAEEVLIWTDVDGILTADPRLVSEARALTHVSYREAAEMSYFGARVIHPNTIVPAMKGGIPIRILNTLNPQHPGTLISESAPILPGGVKTIASIEDLSLVTLDGRGMAGVVGIARRIFDAAETTATNVIMISQASSEQTVSIVVRRHDAKRLVDTLRERFALELAAGAIETISAESQVAVTSIIGRGMAGTPGTAARFFEALAAARINVLSIAQGASELSISVVVDQREAGRAVQAAHTTFGLTRVVHLVVVGCGRVGRTFLQLLHQTRESMEARLGVELRLVGLCNSSRFLFEPDGVDPLAAADALNRAAERPSDQELVKRLLRHHFTDVIMIDVTAADTSKLHRSALENAIHVVTANKRPISEKMSAYSELMQQSFATGVRYGYETTFGAGLPVLHSLEELVHTGDSLISISGCLSGTLGFICTRLQDGVALADAVSEAKERGYTEPDPREDLSGRDVARKALIIARAAGMTLEPKEVALVPMVPNLECGLERAMAEAQEEFRDRVAASAQRGETLRYTADITADAVRVGLNSVPLSSPVGSLRGPDNILVFRTKRYDENPLVIQGPGAGAEVTAAGVLGDVLRVAVAKRLRRT